MTQLTVFARPAWRTTNAYTSLLAEALERQGVSVHEVGKVRSDLPFSRNVLLLHWPDEFYRQPYNIKAWLSAWLRLAHLALAKMLARLRIVWIAHNARPHTGAPDTPPLRWRCFLRLVDGVIALSQASLAEVLAAHPSLRDKPLLVTAHGHYLDQATTPPKLPDHPGDRPIRIAAIGSIRAHKRFADLARAVASSDSQVVLTIRGEPVGPDVTDELSEIAAGCPRITLLLGRMSDTEWEAATDAADLIALPYADVLNSGVLFHALSRFRPVVAPRRGSIPEVHRQVGEAWVHLFDGEFTSATLEQAIAWLRTSRRESPPDLSAQDWDAIGTDMAAYLLAIRNERAR